MRTSAVCVCALICWSAARPLFADPVRITSGRVGSDFEEPASFTFLTASGLQVAGGGGLRELPVACVSAEGGSADPCVTGQRLDFSGTWEGYSDRPALVDGTVVSTAQVQLAFSVAPGTFGVDVGTNRTDSILVRPFTMEGRIIGVGLDGRTVTTTDVFGSGQLAAYFFVGEEGGGNYTGFEYQFEDSTAVPEPGTAVLLFASLGALLRRQLHVANWIRMH